MGQELETSTPASSSRNVIKREKFHRKRLPDNTALVKLRTEQPHFDSCQRGSAQAILNSWEHIQFLPRSRFRIQRIREDGRGSSLSERRCLRGFCAREETSRQAEVDSWKKRINEQVDCSQCSPASSAFVDCEFAWKVPELHAWLSKDVLP